MSYLTLPKLYNFYLFLSILERFEHKGLRCCKSFSTMAPKALQPLIEDKQYSNWERIGTLIVGALAFSVFIWLVVLSAQIGSIKKHEIGRILLNLCIINGILKNLLCV